jgi:hypothetical protein
MRFISPIQWIHWKTTGTLHEMTDFRALEEPWNIVVVSHLLAVPVSVLMCGVGKRQITKTWM